MHRYKTIAHILLVLPIFNIVFAVPVARETYNAHGDVVVPVVVRDVAAMSKERRAESDGTTPSPSSPPPQDETTPSSHSSPPPPDGSTAHPGGSAAVAVSSPPDGSASLPDVPASNQPAASESTSTSRPYTQVTHAMVQPDRPRIPFVINTENMEKFKAIGAIGAISAVDIAAFGLLWHYRNKLPRRAVDPDRHVSSPSTPPAEA